MISLKNVTKVFGSTIGGKTAVNDVSFMAKPGDIIGFLGPNGAGKTTTMRMILGLLRETSGEIRVDDKDPIVDRLKVLNKIGYLPENNPLYGEMKVYEYLDFIAQVKEYENAEELENIIAEVNIDDVLNTKIEELSRGYRQRVGLAVALIGNPEILILDEPTSGLDPLEQDKIKNFIKKIAKEKTVIFSTHILSEVEDVANRLIIIREGSIVYDGKKPTGRGEVDRLFRNMMGVNKGSLVRKAAVWKPKVTVRKAKKPSSK